MKTEAQETVLEIGDHYLVCRNDKSWRKYGYHSNNWRGKIME